MKKIFQVPFLASFLFFQTAKASDYVDVSVPISGVFSPKGFDSNDNTQVIVTGYLPNLCYKDVKSEAKVENNKIEVSVKASLDTRLGSQCLQVAVPYLEAVSVGKIQKGDYSITVNRYSNDSLTSHISVDAANVSDVDDYVYADVQNVRMFPKSRRIILEGNLPSSCLAFDKIKVISNGESTYSVLPILKKVADYCPMQIIPFSQSYTVPTELNAKEILLHVRAIRGKSLNVIFTDSSK